MNEKFQHLYIFISKANRIFYLLDQEVTTTPPALNLDSKFNHILPQCLSNDSANL